MTYAFDPEIAAAIPMLPTSGPGGVDAARQALKELYALLPPVDTTGVRVEDRTVPGAEGDPDVPIRIYRPDGKHAPAAIYDVHGGGFTVGDLDLNHGVNVMLARELGVVVVSVDYRLAPQTTFPGAIEDVYAGLVWTAANSAELCIDARSIVIHGGSAGGGLCAALALLARDRGGPHIAFQVLQMPELDDRLTTNSMTTFIDTPLFSRPAAIESWDAYLGRGVAGGDGVSIYAAPARATDLSGLPPAYISVMEFDPLRDEGIAYARALLASGVSVELHLFPGTFHGSAVIETAAVSQRGWSELQTVLRRALKL